jgi:hypothetical protein
MVIIVLVLARTGFAGGYTEVAHAIDAKWVTITSVCAYAIILSIIIITYFLGDAVPIRMVRKKNKTEKISLPASHMLI